MFTELATVWGQEFSYPGPMNTSISKRGTTLEGQRQESINSKGLEE